MESKVFYYNSEENFYPCTEKGFELAIREQIMWESSPKKTFEEIKEELFESINYSYEYISGKFICLDPFQYDVHNSFNFLVADSEEELNEIYESSLGDI
jgi:hypothetical protein